MDTLGINKVGTDLIEPKMLFFLFVMAWEGQGEEGEGVEEWEEVEVGGIERRGEGGGGVGYGGSWWVVFW